MRLLFLKVSFLIMGLGGMIAQVLLLRELLVSFLGNELTLGIILGNWLILVAAGSLITGKFTNEAEEKMEFFVSLQLSFSIALPFTIYLSRVFKNILLATPGEALGFGPIFYSSFLILLPVALPLGGLFTYGCHVYSRFDKGNASSVGSVYILESAGAMIGGLVVTFLLIPYFNSFEIAFVVSLANTVVCVFLLWPTLQPSRTALLKSLWTISILLSLLFIYGSLSQTARAIHQASIRSQWKNLNVIHSENSIYGNIAVTKVGEQFTFFTNGVPSVTTPVPDIAAIEDFVHFPMLFHGKPESILILTGGAGGMIHEILKYPVSRVDYVELDPLLLHLIQKFSTPLTRSEVSDKRVKVHYADGRFFMNRTQDRFDLIFIGIPAPQELQTNRLFSSEFFAIAKHRMNSEGIIAFTLPGSLTYISPELSDLNRCILDTLKSVFRSVRVIPGDVNLYLASNSSALEKVTPQEIVRRLGERKIQTSLFTKGYIDFRLRDRWTSWLMHAVEGKENQINSDLRPIAVFFSLSYWNALFSPYLTALFKRAQGFSAHLSMVWMIVFTALAGVAFVKKPSLTRHAVPFAIFTTGFAGMLFNLAILFMFQICYGYLYHQIGLLIAIFMLGVALGSSFILRRLGSKTQDSILFLKIEGLMILFSFLLPLVFFVPSHLLKTSTVSLIMYAVFLSTSFLSGAWIGLQFPLATKIYVDASEKAGKIGHTAGLLYGADLLGGFLGGLFGGILLLPILGLKESCFMIAMMKISSGILFLIFMMARKAN